MSDQGDMDATTVRGARDREEELEEGMAEQARCCGTGPTAGMSDAPLQITARRSSDAEPGPLVVCSLGPLLSSP